MTTRAGDPVAARARRRSLRRLALFLAAVAAGGAAWATLNLRHGFGEIPRHWWSALAVAVPLAGAALALLAARRYR